jgi:signal transduction histidine kinase
LNKEKLARLEAERANVFILEFVAVNVSDQGPGIPPDHYTQIFAAFMQLQSNSKGDKGPGPGLAIARGIVEYHGEQIRVNERPGPDVCISFTLPITPAPLDL